MFDMQVATHLKGLAEKAKLNEKHVKIAKTELQERAQYMIEEVERIKSDLKHTLSARAWVESREDEARSSLTTAEGELREVQGELQIEQNNLIETREGLKSAKCELQKIRAELIISRGKLRYLQVELHAVNGDLNDKVTQLEAACREASEAKVLLETARRESSEAANLAERLNEECRGLRADLHQRVSLVAQRDEVIRQLRDQASAQWASRWLAFQQKVIHAYPDMDFNFDLPSDEEAEDSFSTNYSQEPGTPAEAHSPSPSSAPPADA